MERKNPARRLDKRLWFSVVLFAGLIVLQQFLIQPALIRMTSDAPAINLAGRQRMLSQKLAKSALAMTMANDSETRQSRREELIETLETWRTAQTALQSGKGVKTNGLPTSEAILEGFRETQPAYQTMVVAAETLLGCTDDATCRTALDQLLIAEPDFLIRMHDLVGLYEKDAKARVSQLQFWGFVIMLVILCTQLALQLAVVRPEVKMVGREWKQIEADYELLVESMTDGLVVLDSRGRVQFVNRHFSEMLAIPGERILNTSAESFVSETDRKSLVDLLARPADVEGLLELRLIRAGGAVIDTMVSPHNMFDVDGHYCGLLLVVTDITERKAADLRSRQLQTQLAHADRLKSMGTMAAALAHEINQPLGAISNYAAGCLERLSGSSITAKDLISPLKAILRAAHRGAEIVRRTRSFAGPRSHITALESINHLICEVEELCRPEARRRNVLLERQLAATLPAISVDGIQIQQVLTNLIQNAFHALEHVEPQQRQVILSTRFSSEDEIEISVTDSGLGLPMEVQQTWSEPFATTEDDGTGLGLAIAKEIVESHGGRIWHEANPERGAIFRFVLPLNQKMEFQDGNAQSKEVVYVG